MTFSNNQRQSQMYQEEFLDAVSDQIVIINRDGIIQATNKSWNHFCSDHPEVYSSCELGENYFESCKNRLKNGDDYALKILLGLYSLANGEEESYSHTYPVRLSDGERRWFMIKAIPLDEDRNRLALIHRDKTESVQKYHELRESRERYRQQFEQSLEGILITNRKGQITDANPAACEILEVQKNDLLMTKWEEIAVSEDPNYQEAQEKQSQTGCYISEYPIIRADGQLSYIKARARTYRDGNGKLQSIVNFRDITHKKQLEEDILNEKSFTDSVIQSIPGNFYVLDSDGNMVRWNENVIDIFGYSEDELDEVSVLEMIHPEDREKAKRVIATAFETGYGEVELRALTKNGETLHFFYQGKKFESENEEFIVGTGLDITRRKMIEKDNKRQQVMMDQLFENSPIGIARINENREIDQINKSFTDIFGYGKNEAVGQNIDELLISESTKKEAKILSSEGFKGDSFQLDTVRKAKDGNLVPVLVGGVPVELDDKMIAMYGMYADISERKKLEQQIQSLLEKEQEARKKIERSKLRLEEMFTKAHTAISITVGRDFRYKFVNEVYKEITGRDNFEGKTIEEKLPEIKQQGILEIIDHVYTTGEPYYGKEEPVYLDRKGDGELEEVILNFVYKPLKTEDGTIYGVFLQAIDMTEQVNNRKRISKSLEEKEILIKEIHHRVKNNLALITSMIQLQLSEANNEREKHALYATNSRIHSIANIQELMYKHSDLSNIPCQEYIEELAHFPGTMHSPESGPETVQLDLVPVILNINQAIPFALLINEVASKVEQLVDGSVSYTLGITLAEADNQVQLSMSYSGIELPSPLQFDDESSLNDTLIQTLQRQLQASINCTQDDQTNFTVSIHFERSGKNGSSSCYEQEA